MKIDFVSQARDIRDDLIVIRRDLHINPEVGANLPRTQDRVLRALDGLGLEISLGRDLSSVVAVLHGGKPGPSVILRADMDALPVKEDTGLEYASRNGNMHACGHDMHTSALIGAARLLASHSDHISGSVIFMFQPNEEGSGGAEPMIEEGLLDITSEKPVAAYGIHVQTGPGGRFFTRPGTLMAGFSDLEITMRGAGGHSSQPQLATNPVPAIAELAMSLNTMTAQQFDIFDPVVMPVTQLSGSEANNVIPESASLGACIRYLNPDLVDDLRHRIATVARGIASAHQCTAEIAFDVGFPVTVNDETETQRTVDELRSVFGVQRVGLMANPDMGSEDFSFVLAEVPGTYVFLSASPDNPSQFEEDNHSPRVQFDDAWLGDAAAGLAHLAFTRLTDG